MISQVLVWLLQWTLPMQTHYDYLITGIKMSYVFLLVSISKTVPITDLYDQYINIHDVLYWLRYRFFLRFT